MSGSRVVLIVLGVLLLMVASCFGIAGLFLGREFDTGPWPAYLLTVVCVGAAALCFWPWKRATPESLAERIAEDAADQRPKGIRLVGAVSPYKDRVWILRRRKQGLVLLNAMDEVVLKIPNDFAAMHFKIPAQWGSIKQVLIAKGDGDYYCFHVVPEVLSRLQKWLEACQLADPRAAAAVMRKKANVELIIGGVALALGLVITLGSLVLAAPGGTFIVMIGLIVGGIAALCLGAYWHARAGQLKASSRDEED